MKLLFTVLFFSLICVEEINAEIQYNSFESNFVAIKFTRHPTIRNLRSYEITIHKNGDALFFGQIGSNKSPAVKLKISNNDISNLIYSIKATDFQNQPESHTSGDECEFTLSSGGGMEFVLFNKDRFYRSIYYSGCMPNIPSLEALGEGIDKIVGAKALYEALKY